MALIKCSECGNEVSDQAFTCPKCGAPLKVMSQKKCECLTAKEEAEWLKENEPSFHKIFIILSWVCVLLIALGVAVAGIFLIIAGIICIILALKLKSLGCNKQGNGLIACGIAAFGLFVVTCIIVGTTLV